MNTTIVTDLSKLPVVLTLDEVASILRCSKHTIRRALQQKTFRPAPFERMPYRWLKSDLERHLQRRSAEQETPLRRRRR